MKPVYQTVNQERRYRVMKPVYETSMVDQSYSVCRPVTTVRQGGAGVRLLRSVNTRWFPGRIVERSGASSGAGRDILQDSCGLFSVASTSQQGGERRRSPFQCPPRMVRERVFVISPGGPRRYRNPVRSRETMVRPEVPVKTCRYVAEDRVESITITTCQLVAEVRAEPYEVRTCRYVPEERVESIPVTTCQYVAEERVEPIEVRKCEMVAEERVETVPVTTCQYVAEEHVEPYEVRTCRYVAEERVETIPVTTCQYVSEQHVERVPVTTCRMVAETASRQVAVSVPEQVPVTVNRCVAPAGASPDRRSAARRWCTRRRSDLLLLQLTALTIAINV